VETTFTEGVLTRVEKGKPTTAGIPVTAGTPTTAGVTETLETPVSERTATAVGLTAIKDT
jgi:hypothetical protein